MKSENIVTQKQKIVLKNVSQKQKLSWKIPLKMPQKVRNASIKLSATDGKNDVSKPLPVLNANRLCQYPGNHRS